MKQLFQLVFMLALLLVCAIIPAHAQNPQPIPKMDLHVHQAPGLTIEQAVLLSKEKGVQLGIVEHPGICPYCPIENDSLLTAYISKLRQYPVYVGLQPVTPGWRQYFSQEALDQLDYVIMDALEIPQADGSIWRIWQDDTQVSDIDDFMEMYVTYNIQVIDNEGINVLANAAFLPKCIANDYRKAWTKERMQKVIGAAVKHHVAFEINSFYRVPKKEFIQLAKAAGAKFSFGTDSRNNFAGTMDYALEMVKECHLEAKDIFVPKNNENTLSSE